MNLEMSHNAASISIILGGARNEWSAIFLMPMRYSLSKAHNLSRCVAFPCKGSADSLRGISAGIKVATINKKEQP